jgi:two-component system, cell cycle response regulator
LSLAKVLVADDSPLVLRMLETMLEGAGLAVVTARDGLEAIEKAVAEDVAMVILDVTMPRMNGYQACRLLKTEPATKDLPVAILTSRDQAGDRFWGLETGADYYITKDSEPQRILELVRNVLEDQAAGPAKPPREARRTSVDILSRVNELLDRKLYEATILSEIGQVARSLVQFDETFTSIMALVARVVDFTLGAVSFVEGDSLDVVLMHHRKASAAVLEEFKARVLESVVREHGSDFDHIRARLFAPEGGALGTDETALGGFAVFPVTTNNRLVGLLALAGKHVSRMGRETEAYLGQVANQAHIVMENSRLFERVRNLSIRDSLTELFNHRHSVELLANEFERVGRYHQDGMSVLMVDIDHFKKINDEHGHLVGDVVLRDVARVMRETLRTVDSVGRYGGEEFMIILPHTPRDEAWRTAERLRRTVADHVFSSSRKGTGLQVTVSVGVASYPSEKVDTPSALIRAADEALYRAKEKGRNRVA